MGLFNAKLLCRVSVFDNSNFLEKLRIRIPQVPLGKPLHTTSEEVDEQVGQRDQVIASTLLQVGEGVLTREQDVPGEWYFCLKLNMSTIRLQICLRNAKIDHDDL